jgi:hypothetical protein
MDPISFIMFFFVVVPFVLIHLFRQRKSTQELIELQKETNKLLSELMGKFKE